MYTPLRGLRDIIDIPFTSLPLVISNSVSSRVYISQAEILIQDSDSKPEVGGG